MDLTTNYMGLTLKHPVVPSASPIVQHVDNIRKLEDAGAPAITMYSIFEEQLDMQALALHHFLEQGTFFSAEAQSYFPSYDEYRTGPEQYLELIRAAKEAVDIPVIGSLNGVTIGGWTKYARQIQQAGADALELNIYYIPTNPALPGADVERLYLDILGEVKSSVTIPVAVKLSPFFSAMPNVAVSLANAGADALVLFNRFYQPEVGS